MFRGDFRALRRVAALGCAAGLVIPDAEAGTVLMPIHEPYPSVRSQGLAGAGVALGDGEEALFLNPAGIGSTDESKLILRDFSFPNATAGANASSIRLIEAQARNKNAAFDELEQILLKPGADILYARASLFPTFTLWRTQWGILVDGDTEGFRSLESPSSASGSEVQGRINAWARSQAVAVAGLSFPYRNTGWSLGFTARGGFRTSVFHDVDIVNGTIRKTERGLLPDLNRTKGVAGDVGILYASPRAWVPSFGVHLRDVGDTLYHPVTKQGATERERSALTLGCAFSPFDQNRKGATHVRFTFEGHHLNDGRLSNRDKFRMGGEFLLGRYTSTSPFSIRIGHNLRGFSYGATVDAILAKLEMGSFVEAVSGEGQVRLDRRTFVRLTVDLRQ